MDRNFFFLNFYPSVTVENDDFVNNSFLEILLLTLEKCTVADDFDSDDGISILLEADDKNADKAIESLKNLDDLSSLSLSGTTVDDSILDVEVLHLMEDGIKWTMDAENFKHITFVVTHAYYTYVFLCLKPILH